MQRDCHWHVLDAMTTLYMTENRPAACGARSLNNKRYHWRQKTTPLYSVWLHEPNRDHVYWLKLSANVLVLERFNSPSSISFHRSRHMFSCEHATSTQLTQVNGYKCDRDYSPHRIIVRGRYLREFSL